MNLSESVQSSIDNLLRSPDSELVTPAYIYSVEQVRENYRDLKDGFGTPVVVSIKANHCPELLSRTAYNFEDGCEFASLGELRKRAGTRKKVYINTPAYTRKFVAVAARYDAVFTIDHLEQMDIIAEVKRQGGFNGNGVIFRLNLDAIAREHGARLSDHFGMDEPQLFEAVGVARSLDIKVAGLHVFCGSNGFVDKSASCVELVERLNDQVIDVLGYSLEVVNLGGGMPTDWRDRDIDFAAYRTSIAKLKARTNVIHEAGRAIFGSAGYFVTEVISVKSINGKRFVVCDGGISQNFLLAKTESVIRKYDRPAVIGSRTSAVGHDYTFVGSSCSGDDVIGAIEACQFEIAPGDKVLFNNCGAYNAAYTVNKFLALKEYTEYII